MQGDGLLKKMEGLLEGVFGPRLRGLVLYGSEARGEAGPESGIDLLVLLDGPPREPRDSWAVIDALYPLALDMERPVHAEPVNIAEFEAGAFRLYRSARREGIVLVR